MHWLPLRVNNREVEDWVHNLSDEIKDISYETSVATQAEGLITSLRRIRCILREGVTRTDIPYKKSIMADIGSLYTVLISVEGRLPECLKCEKLGHIRRDCKAKKCLGCYHLTDEHVTATCPYENQYSTKASNLQAQPKRSDRLGLLGCNILRVSHVPQDLPVLTSKGIRPKVGRRCLREAAGDWPWGGTFYSGF